MKKLKTKSGTLTLRTLQHSGSAAVRVKSLGLKYADGGTESQRAAAFERAQETWWNDAKHIAQARGYDTVHSIGRSSGYCAPYPQNDDELHSVRFALFAADIAELTAAFPAQFADELSEQIAADNARPVYSREGRTILRDGVRIFFLQRCGNDSAGYALAPYEADEYAVKILAFLESQA